MTSRIEATGNALDPTRMERTARLSEISGIISAGIARWHIASAPPTGRLVNTKASPPQFYSTSERNRASMRNAV